MDEIFLKREGHAKIKNAANPLRRTKMQNIAKSVELEDQIEY